MYRNYEDPYYLEARLAEARAELAKDPDNFELYLEIEELKDRVNFAWQDDEAEVNGWE